MGEIWIREFTGGLDTRRMPETTSGGVLIEATDGHITRGGEFEKRAAFVPTYTVPGTVGMAYTRAGVYVFGHASSVSVPSGVTYQQLAAPGGLELVRILSWDLYRGRLYVSAQFIDGSIFHFYDGALVTNWYDGRARAAFTIDSGDVTGDLTALYADGVDILGASVPWATSNSATAAAIAAQVNAYTSTPDYSAVATDNLVAVSAATAGAAANGRVLAGTTSGVIVVTPIGDAVFVGGSDEGVPPGTFVKTHGFKMYVTSESNLFFSGIERPTEFSTDAVGAGFVDLSLESSGSEELTSIGQYQRNLAVFAENVIQIWYVDPDPALNTPTQSLNNTGTAAPHSVVQFGDNDLFYLNESGVRSLRARDASNAASTADVGVPIDSLVVDKLRAMSGDDRKRAIGLIEPRDGRLWMILKDEIFAFSYFSGVKVSAWSTYSPGFNVDYAFAFDRRVYLRSGSQIYVYGGLGDTVVYDGTVAVARLPYLDGEKPATKKNWSGFDAALIGTWRVKAAMAPTDLNAIDEIGVYGETTFGADRMPLGGSSTHISLIFETVGDGYARLGSALLHHDLSDDQD